MTPSCPAPQSIIAALDVLRGPHTRLYPKQIDFLNCEKRFAAFVGGIGSGKSFVLCYDLLMRARQCGGLYMVLAPTYPMLRDSTLRTFFDHIHNLDIKMKFNKSEHRMMLPGSGAEILFRSTDNPETLRGPNVSGIAVDEASLMPRMVYEIAIGRLRQGHEVGPLRAAFTPKGPTHWTYEVFATQRPDTALFRAHTDENPFLPEDFAATIARQYGETQFARQELAGEFVQVEGAEFPAEWFDFPGFWFTDWPTQISHKVLYLDPSKGKTDKAGDYQCYALAALARLPDVGNVICLDAWLGHEPLPALIARGVRIIHEFQPLWVGYEDNGTMGFMAPEIARQCEGQLIPFWQPITNSESKLGRMRSLSTYLSRRMIRIRNTAGGKLLRAQMGDVPFGEFDDGPDAAAGAVRALEKMVNAR